MLIVLVPNVGARKDEDPQNDHSVCNNVLFDSDIICVVAHHNAKGTEHAHGTGECVGGFPMVVPRDVGRLRKVDTGPNGRDQRAVPFFRQDGF